METRGGFLHTLICGLAVPELGLTLYERNCVKRAAASAVNAGLINEFPIDAKEQKSGEVGEISLLKRDGAKVEKT